MVQSNVFGNAEPSPTDDSVLRGGFERSQRFTACVSGHGRHRKQSGMVAPMLPLDLERPPKGRTGRRKSSLMAEGRGGGVTTVTSVTSVTGWADTFAVTVVAHESRSNPSQAAYFISPGISSGGRVVGARLYFDSGIVPRPPAKESGRPEREWLRRPFRRVVPPGTARQGELLALAPCGGVGCGRRSGRPRHPVGALAQGIY
jgi:hypothetical protein